MDKIIKKVKLSDGSVYSFFDNGALRLNENNILITGNNVVDQVIIQKNLTIIEIDDVPIEQTIDNVLVQDKTTGRIMKRSTDQLLADIGGISCSVEGSTFSVKIGK